MRYIYIAADTSKHAPVFILSSDSESDTDLIDFEKLSKECEFRRKKFWKKFDDGN